jgi:transposase
MGHVHGEDFKREAVRLARHSGLTRKQVAADLGIGLSTLGKWISAYQPEAPTDLPSADLHAIAQKLNTRPRKTLGLKRLLLLWQRMLQ